MIRHRVVARAALGLALGFAVACGATPPVVQTARPAARAAVDVAKDAWVLLAHACIDVAKIPGTDPKILDACQKTLPTAHDLILDAATAVDVDWSPKSGCAVLQAAQLLAQVASGLGGLGTTILPVVTDAVALAGVVGSCGSTPSDAGVDAPDSE